MDMAVAMSDRCLAQALPRKSGGREALSFGNKHAKYFMVGSCQWSNLYPLFCIHAQPIAIQFDNQFPRQRRSHSVCRNQISASGLKSATPDGSLQESTNEQTFLVWQNFVRRVSGEWDGYGAEFSPEGNPIELPESVVPEAFREWEVKVYDWQTQCPTLAEEKISLLYKSIKLLPTVGCEADAATRHSVDERQIGGIDNEVSSFVFHSSGCYVAVWPGRSLMKETYVPHLKDSRQNKERCNILEIEHCLVEGQNSESRVRIVQEIDLQEINEKQKPEPRLQKITVYSEQWYGPYRNGEQLGGCSISGSAFASRSPLKASQIAGTWKAQNLVAELEIKSELFKGLVENGSEDITRDSRELVFLPNNLWCNLRLVDSNQFISEVGWLLDSNSAVTSNCEVSIDGKLKKSTVRFEQQCSRRSLESK